MAKNNAYGVYFIFKSMEQGPTFRISMPKYPTKDPHYRILAHQRSRFTHYYFYIRDEVLGCRWQVELFFKWIKQHLRIKRFYGTSENAVRTQIWIAISVYVLVAIIKKKLQLDVSLHTLLQILSLTLFEKLPLKQAVAGVEPIANSPTFTADSGHMAA